MQGERRKAPKNAGTVLCFRPPATPCPPSILAHLRRSEREMLVTPHGRNRREPQPVCVVQLDPVITSTG